MAGRNNSLLDADFEDDDDLLNDDRQFGSDDLPDTSVKTIDVSDKEEDKLEIEVADDTPEADRGKWNADNVSTDTKEEEAAAYSQRVRDRIAKETAKVHAERRAKEDRERQLNELSGAAKKLIEENNRLKGLIENGEKVLMSESTGRIDGQIAAAKAAYREAVEAGDVNGQLAAQENLAKAIAEKDRMSTYRPAPIPRTDEKDFDKYTAPVQQQQQVMPDQRALSWQEQNKWFGRDEGMTAYAMGLHSQMVNREGIMPQGDTYWNRLDTEMRKRFPEKFPTNSRSEPRRTDTVVAPAVRSNNGKVTRKVTLTSSQVQLARRLGLTVEQYAEQVALENGRKD